MKVGILKNYFGNGISKIGILKNYFENEIFIRGNLGEWHMAWEKVAMHSQTLQHVLYFYNIKFKSSLWIPSQNSFLYVFKLIPIFIVLSPVRSKPIFMLKKNIIPTPPCHFPMHISIILVSPRVLLIGFWW